MSYLFYTHYLQNHIVPPDAPSTPRKTANQHKNGHSDEQFIENRERCIDEELAASMPASDPPSWTMGGSAISKRRHN